MVKYHHRIFLIDSWILDASSLPPAEPQIAHFSVASVVYWPVHPVATDFPDTVGEPEHAVFASLIPLHLSDLTRPSLPKRQKVSYHMTLPPPECSPVFCTKVFYYLKPAFVRSGHRITIILQWLLYYLKVRTITPAHRCRYIWDIWACRYPTCLNHFYPVTW